MLRAPWAEWHTHPDNFVASIDNQVAEQMRGLDLAQPVTLFYSDNTVRTQPLRWALYDLLSGMFVPDAPYCFTNAIVCYKRDNNGKVVKWIETV